MAVYARKLIYTTAAASIILCLGAAAAEARTTHHHVRTHHAARHASGSSVIKIAQRHLSNLGYYNGKIDGVMGPATKRAIKKFQRDNELKADGILGRKTNAALAAADHPIVKGAGEFQTHESVLVPSDTNVNPDYEASAARSLNTRFGSVNVAESGAGNGRRYDVTVNGQPILVADGQPSTIGVSPVYNLANEDAIIFTTYSPGEGTCLYRNHILAIGGNAGTKILDVGDCTRHYEANVVDGILYINFPESDGPNAVGASWRLDGETLSKL